MTPMHSSPLFRFSYQLPFGAILREGGVQFSVVSRMATSMKLLLYDNPEDPDPVETIPFNPTANRWGDVWTIFMEGVKPGQLYHFQADGPFLPEKGLRFQPKARLIDPYAKALCGDFLPSKDGIIRPPKCVVIDDTFDWEGEHHLRRDLANSIIYELHVGGFTSDPSSGVAHPGTYLGLVEKIPYLKSLGITTIELMPVHEFPINSPNGTKNSHPNYWGYDPIAFFAPHRGYAVSKEPGAQVLEFKQMIRAMHTADIEVILDVVFNHTAEGNEWGPTFTFKGLDNRAYYLLDGKGNYRNYSGCGNTVNGNHPLTRELIFCCLRHWVQNYHIDGFRFDLASILSRDRGGNLVANPPILEDIAEDPRLSETKIIAEAWDAAGAYQVGSFGSERWAEWNGHFRDEVRRFWRADPGMIPSLATRLAGSSDLYASSNRQPSASINFITAHDGFTLNDLVSYNQKHNEENGEDNRDGENNNMSYNCGIEGETDYDKVIDLRRRQMRNLLATLLFSQGVPMITAGDEICRTQRGNNNAWCQNNPISWIQWGLLEKNSDFFRFATTLIRTRRGEPQLRRGRYLIGEKLPPSNLSDIAWFAPDGGNIDWSSQSNLLTVFLSGDARPGEHAGLHHFLIFLNGTPEIARFAFPSASRPDTLSWRLFVDTAAEPPKDIYPNFDGPMPLPGMNVTLESRSMQIFACERRSAVSTTSKNLVFNRKETK